jgi:transposase
MDGMLVDALPGAELIDLADLVRQMRREVIELRQEVDHLRRENLELRQRAGYWKGMHAKAVRRIEELQAENDQLRGEIRELKDQLFGRKSEKASRDRSNVLEGEDEDETPPAVPRARGQRADRPGPPRRDNSHLPVVEEIRELPEGQPSCPRCGAAMIPSDTEDSELIEIQVSPYRRRIRRRRYQRACSCPDSPRTIIATPAPKLIPKGRLGVSIWVEILLDKFVSHRPTERLLAQWRLLGLDIAAGTVAGGLQRLVPLFAPLYEALLERNAGSPLAQADETRWMAFIVLEGKRGHRWWLWVFLGEDTVAFRLDPGRDHDVPEGHFPPDAKAVLMVDRYSAYKAMARVKSGNIVLAFCWAHARRDFVKVGKGWPKQKEWASAWLRLIRELYHHNRLRLAADATDAAYRLADAELNRVASTMKAKAAAELAEPNLATPCRQALSSLQGHWEGLTRFLDDPRIPMDNNASERRVRGPALGRKNYYGSGALWSGRLAAMLFSLLATLSMAGLNVRAWLTDYLKSCAESGGRAPSDITPFLPWTMPAETRSALAMDPYDSS